MTKLLNRNHAGTMLLGLAAVATTVAAHRMGRPGPTTNPVEAAPAPTVSLAKEPVVQVEPTVEKALPGLRLVDRLTSVLAHGDPIVIIAVIAVAMVLIVGGIATISAMTGDGADFHSNYRDCSTTYQGCDYQGW